jgi:hypothetical protein
MLLLSTMMVKALHYHHYISYSYSVPTSAVQWSADKGIDDCPICHYIFSPLEELTTFSLPFYALLVGLVFAIPLIFTTVRHSSFHYLRAPPAVCK